MKHRIQFIIICVFALIFVVLSFVISENDKSSPLPDEALYIKISTTEMTTKTTSTQATTTNKVQPSETITEADTATILNDESQTETTTIPLTSPIRLEYGKGNMYFDSSPENKFIQKIVDERNIDEKLCVSVFALPDEGLNYVLEFSDLSFTFDDLRRVYLIDINGNLDSVAAKDSSERENVTAVENNICMNVLIKQGVFPCIEQYLGGT
jgi:hypothetical protein